MIISVPTLVAYTASILALAGVIFLILGLASTRRRWFATCSLPFLMGFLGCALLVNDSILPNRLALHLGTACLLAGYGSGWMVVRRFHGRRALAAIAFGVPAAWLLLSVGVFGPWRMLLAGAVSRTLVMALFSALCAWEMSRARAEDLPSRALLQGVFIGFAFFSLLRMALSGYLPMPLGGLPTEVWAVVAYNLSSVAHVLLVAALLIALSHERVARRNQLLSLRDPLTDALNRRAFTRDAEAMAAAARARPLPVAVLAFDLDHFKSINDRFGHDVGDRVIQAAAQAARQVLRGPDLLYRMGGEEFLCVLPNTTADQAAWLAERLRHGFEAAGQEVAGLRVAATMSLGLAAGTLPGTVLAELASQADAALYEAKHAGRNCVRGATAAAPSLRQA